MKFNSSQFTPTEHSTAEDKAKFANQFVEFVSGGFRRSDFPKWFYTRLSMTFGHIAHYNQEGFYSYFFEDTAAKVNFLKWCAEAGCYGSPKFTYCDVEREIQTWLRANNCVARATMELKSEIENSDRTEYDRLKGKFERTNPSQNYKL